MKNKYTKPSWMKDKLRNKKINEILIIISGWVTDGAVQQIYEYIKKLEEEDK